MKTQKLITAEIKRVAKKYPIYSQDGKNGEAIVLARFFSPYTHYVWYMLEYDANSNEGFGLCVRGDFTEYGYFSLEELQKTVHKERLFGVMCEAQAFERDISVKPGKYKLKELLKMNKEKLPYWDN